MKYPVLSDALRLERLAPPDGKIRMVLDTDTYNEVDDQFAVVYALCSRERMAVEALYAAPFFNEMSTGPRDGMEKSHAEILRVLDRMHLPVPENFVFRGSPGYLPGPETPVESAAAADLVKRAMASEDPLYVVAIGAITNVASAILMEPRIIERIVVVWLGGNALYWPHTREFNLQQDIHAARVILDSGVPLVLLPCQGVVTHLTTTVPELERFINGRSDIGTYLTETVRACGRENMAWSRVIWDVSTIAWLNNPDWVPTDLVHSPILTDQLTWSADNSRHLIRVARHVDRDAVFTDLFKRVNGSDTLG
jgi:inosine-uridine nucleoside N-ribohydrolase